MVFGNYIYKFSTISESFYTLFRTILGDFDFHELERAHWFLGPAYFISYVMVVFFVLVNMFLAIINESYSAVKEEASNKRGGKEFQEVDFKRKIKRTYYCKIFSNFLMGKFTRTLYRGSLH